MEYKALGSHGELTPFVLVHQPLSVRCERRRMSLKNHKMFGMEDGGTNAKRPLPTPKGRPSEAFGRKPLFRQKTLMPAYVKLYCTIVVNVQHSHTHSCANAYANAYVCSSCNT